VEADRKDLLVGVKLETRDRLGLQHELARARREVPDPDPAAGRPGHVSSRRAVWGANARKDMGARLVVRARQQRRAVQGERGDEIGVSAKEGHLLRDAGRPVALSEVQALVDVEPASEGGFALSAASLVHQQRAQRTHHCDGSPGSGGRTGSFSARRSAWCLHSSGLCTIACHLREICSKAMAG
jgi:hypothetical protein